MEELLPLLFGLLWLIYTIYNKGKKRDNKRQPVEAEEESQTPSILEQLLTDNDVFKPESFGFEEEPVVEHVDVPKERIPEPQSDSKPFYPWLWRYHYRRIWYYHYCHYAHSDPTKNYPVMCILGFCHGYDCHDPNPDYDLLYAA